MTSTLTASVICWVNRFWSSDGDARWILLCRVQKGIGIDDALALDEVSSPVESGPASVCLSFRAEDLGCLAEDAGNLVQASDVVLVMLDGVEGHGIRQIRERGMDAVKLVDGHLVFF